MGYNDIPLNRTGVIQANNVKKLLKNLSISKIISSPLLRAKQTAEIVNNELLLPIIYSNCLKERDWGAAKNVVSRYSNIITDEDTPIGAETESEFEKRILNVINEILNEEGTQLIVAHGGVFVTLSALTGERKAGADNCVPYLFKPCDYSRKWDIIELTCR